MRGLFAPADLEPPANPAPRGVMIGNIWSADVLAELRCTIRGSGLRVDWYGNAGRPFLEPDPTDLARDGITLHPNLADEALIPELRKCDYAIMPSRTLSESDEHDFLYRASLPSRLVYLFTTAHLPVVVLGGADTTAAKFVTGFGLGAVSPYEPKRFAAAVERVTAPPERDAIRGRAVALSPYFAAEPVADWIWRSAAIGRPVDDRYERLFAAAELGVGRGRSNAEPGPAVRAGTGVQPMPACSQKRASTRRRRSAPRRSGARPRSARGSGRRCRRPPATASSSVRNATGRRRPAGAAEAGVLDQRRLARRRGSGRVRSLNQPQSGVDVDRPARPRTRRPSPARRRGRRPGRRPPSAGRRSRQPWSRSASRSPVVGRVDVERDLEALRRAPRQLDELAELVDLEAVGPPAVLDRAERPAPGGDRGEPVAARRRRSAASRRARPAGAPAASRCPPVGIGQSARADQLADREVDVVARDVGARRARPRARTG